VQVDPEGVSAPSEGEVQRHLKIINEDC